MRSQAAAHMLITSITRHVKNDGLKRQGVGSRESPTVRLHHRQKKLNKVLDSHANKHGYKSAPANISLGSNVQTLAIVTFSP